jgi:hypothetical protein
MEASITAKFVLLLSGDEILSSRILWIGLEETG